MVAGAALDIYIFSGNVHNNAYSIFKHISDIKLYKLYQHPKGITNTKTQGQLNEQQCAFINAKKKQNQKQIKTKLKATECLCAFLTGFGR